LNALLQPHAPGTGEVGADEGVRTRAKRLRHSSTRRRCAAAPWPSPPKVVNRRAVC